MTVTAYYINDHNQQTDDHNSQETQSSGCTWTTLASGVDASTAGDRAPTPDHVHRQVRPGEESVPGTDGWSIPDADLAMSRMGIPFRNLTGGRFEGVRNEHEQGRYIVAQGDSEEFGNNTCSGKFNGDHCIGIHPDNKPDPDGEGVLWRVDDPICKDSRYEKPAVIRRYMENLDVRCRYGVFANPVPLDPPVIMRHGAKALPRPTRKRITRKVQIRRKPERDSNALKTKHRGDLWVAYQVVRKSDGVWFGNRRGRRWLPEGAF